jgi:hypothetical protein
MADDIKRLNYFTNQFLVQEDFQAEQDYHRRMRHLHNQRSHTPGIVYGLEVTQKENTDRDVIISAGMAINGDGKEIVVLEGGITHTLSTIELTNVVYLSIAASDVDVDPYKGVGFTDKFTRKAERPKLNESSVLAPNAIVIAKLSFDRGRITTVDSIPSVRKISTARIAPNAIGTSQLVDSSVTLDKIADASVTEGKLASPLLRRLSNIEQSQLQHNKNLYTPGVFGDGFVVTFTEGGWRGTGGRGPLQIAAKRIETGNTSFIDPTISLTISPGIMIDSTGREIVSSNSIIYLFKMPGMENTNDSFSGFLVLRWDSVSQQIIIQAQKDKPQDISAILLANISVNMMFWTLAENSSQVVSSQINSFRKPVSINIIAQEDANIVDTAGININSNVVSSSFSSSGADIKSTATTTTGAFSRGVNYGLKVYSESNGNPLGVTGNPQVWGYGIYVNAIGNKNSQIYGIYVESLGGSTNVPLHVNGRAVVTGGIAAGHIMDRFINASGQRLRTGDLVKLKGTPVTHFTGENNKIPIAEVTLSDCENDTKVIGIVEGESIPSHNVPDTRTDRDDPTFIEVGGMLDLVVLGVYAHCKVDATEAPIEVGDYSPHPIIQDMPKKRLIPNWVVLLGKL